MILTQNLNQNRFKLTRTEASLEATENAIADYSGNQTRKQGQAKQAERMNTQHPGIL
jgi:hypothetical protein